MVLNAPFSKLNNDTLAEIIRSIASKFDVRLQIYRNKKNDSWGVVFSALIVCRHKAKCTLCGTEGGADMWDGFRINGENFSKLYTNHIDLDAKGVDFYDGEKESAADLEARLCIECILNNTDPIVEQFGPVLCSN